MNAHRKRAILEKLASRKTVGETAYSLLTSSGRSAPKLNISRSTMARPRQKVDVLGNPVTGATTKPQSVRRELALAKRSKRRRNESARLRRRTDERVTREQSLRRSSGRKPGPFPVPRMEVPNLRSPSF